MTTNLTERDVEATVHDLYLDCLTRILNRGALGDSRAIHDDVEETFEKADALWAAYDAQRRVPVLQAAE